MKILLWFRQFITIMPILLGTLSYGMSLNRVEESPIDVTLFTHSHVTLAQLPGGVPLSVMEIITQLNEADRRAALFTNPIIAARLKPSCIFLYGPPGTGKNTIASFIASATKRKIAAVNCASFITGVQGSGARRLRQLFEAGRRIAQSEPVLIFIDEVDGLARDNHGPSDGERDMTERALFEQLDKKDPNIIVVFACNAYDKIPAPLKNRANKSIPITLPTLQERVELITYYLTQVHHNIPKTNYCILAEKVDQLSRRQIADLILVEMVGLVLMAKNTVCTEQDFFAALTRVKCNFSDKRALVSYLLSLAEANNLSTEIIREFCAYTETASAAEVEECIKLANGIAKRAKPVLITDDILLLATAMTMPKIVQSRSRKALIQYLLNQHTIVISQADTNKFVEWTQGLTAEHIHKIFDEGEKIARLQGHALSMEHLSAAIALIDDTLFQDPVKRKALIDCVLCDKLVAPNPETMEEMTVLFSQSSKVDTFHDVIKKAEEMSLPERITRDTLLVAYYKHTNAPINEHGHIKTCMEYLNNQLVKSVTCNGEIPFYWPHTRGCSFSTLEELFHALRYAHYHIRKVARHNVPLFINNKHRLCAAYMVLPTVKNDIVIRKDLFNFLLQINNPPFCPNNTNLEEIAEDRARISTRLAEKTVGLTVTFDDIVFILAEASKIGRTRNPVRIIGYDLFRGLHTFFEKLNQPVRIQYRTDKWENEREVYRTIENARVPSGILYWPDADELYALFINWLPAESAITDAFKKAFAKNYTRRIWADGLRSIIQQAIACQAGPAITDLDFFHAAYDLFDIMPVLSGNQLLGTQQTLSFEQRQQVLACFLSNKLFEFNGNPEAPMLQALVQLTGGCTLQDMRLIVKCFDDQPAQKNNFNFIVAYYKHTNKPIANNEHRSLCINDVRTHYHLPALRIDQMGGILADTHNCTYQQLQKIFNDAAAYAQGAAITQEHLLIGTYITYPHIWNNGDVRKRLYIFFLTREFPHAQLDAISAWLASRPDGIILSIDKIVEVARRIKELYVIAERTNQIHWSEIYVAWHLTIESLWKPVIRRVESRTDDKGLIWGAFFISGISEQEDMAPCGIVYYLSKDEIYALFCWSLVPNNTISDQYKKQFSARFHRAISAYWLKCVIKRAAVFARQNPVTEQVFKDAAKDFGLFNA